MALTETEELQLREELDAAITSGNASAELSAREQLEAGATTGKDEPGFLMDNLEIPFGIAGGIGGFVLGGPPGAVAGGAGGSAVGSLLEDVLEGRKLQFDEAAKEAAISGVFDVATMGTAKLFRPLFKPLGIVFDDLVSSFKPSKALPSVGPRAPAPLVGTPESLQRTQEIVETTGGSLSAAQTGKAGKLRTLFEDIGNAGIFSRARKENTVALNGLALRNEVARQVDGINAGLATAPVGVGETLIEVINAGRGAVSTVYGNGLDTLKATYGSQRASVAPILKNIDAFMGSGAREWGSVLSDGTRKNVEAIRELVTNAPNGTLSVSDLLDLDKRVNTIISEVGDFNSAKFSAIDSRELAQFSSTFREGIADTFRSKVSINLADDYGVLKKEFGDSVGSLLPDLTSTFIGQAKKGNYDSLGRLVMTSSNTSQIRSMMGSIDTAFKQLEKSGADMSKLTVKSANEAKQLIRQSYVKNVFGELSAGTDIGRFSKLAHRAEVPAEKQRLQAIMGGGFDDYKNLLNAIADTEKADKGGFLSLAFRSRETSSLLNVGAAVGTTAATSSIAPALLIFSIPEVLSRVATNKGAVRRLLGFEAAFKRNPTMKPALVASWTGKIIEALSQEDQIALSEAIKNYSPPAPAQPPQQQQQPVQAPQP